MSYSDEKLYQMVGERIRNNRKRLNLSQAQLADKLNISRASVVNIEAGRQRPPLHLLWRIAEDLGTDLIKLVPSREEYVSSNEPIKLAPETIAQIENAANGDVLTRRSLTEFIKRVRST